MSTHVAALLSLADNEGYISGVKPLNKTILLGALVVTFAPSSSKKVWARNSPYVLDIRPFKGDDSDDKIVRLRNKKSKRIIWTRKVYGPNVFWSKNHRAVAVDGVSQILVWHEGYRLRDFAPIAARSLGGSYDYFMGCVWSPDNRRLLVRFGGSGNEDANLGALYCLKLGRWPRYQYKRAPSEHNVWKMAWRDSRTALFLPSYDTGKDYYGYSSTPRRWRVP